MANNGQSCSIVGHVRDKLKDKNTDKESLLHKGLLLLLNFCKSWTRTDANRLYSLTKTKLFQKMYDGKVLVNADNEPILVSLWEEMGDGTPIKNVTMDLMQAALNFRFKSGLYEYEEALDKCIQFNESLEGSKTFMGMLEYDRESGQFKFSVVPHTVENHKAFLKQVSDKEAFDTIVNRLQDAGINIDQLFPTDDERRQHVTGKYSTENYQKLYDGIHGLLLLLDTNNDVRTITRETGHLVIGALHDSKLVDRLEKLVSTEEGMKVVALILGDEGQYLIKNSENPVREIMGHLVAKYLNDIVRGNDSFKDMPAWKKILSRIWQQAKNVWHKVYSLTTLQYDRMLAEKVARKMAKSFLNSKGLFGDIQGAPSETLYNSVNTAEDRKRIEHTITDIKNKLVTLEQKFDETLGKRDDARNIKSMLSELVATLKVLQKSEEIPDTEAYRAAIDDVIKFLNQEHGFIVQALDVIRNELISHENDVDYFDKEYSALLDPKTLAEFISLIMQAEYIKLTVDSIYSVITDSNNRTVSILSGDTADESFKTAVLMGSLNTLHEAFDSTHLGRQIEERKQDMIKQFLTSINGCDAFYVPSYNTFKSVDIHSLHGEKPIKEGNANSFRLLNGNPNELTIDDIMGSTHTGMLCWVDRYFYSMAHYPHIMTLLYHKAIVLAKHDAEVESYKMLETLWNIHKEYSQEVGSRDLKTAMTRFYETDPETHEYTGNFIQSLNYGQFERERDEAIQEAFDEWLQGEGNEYAVYDKSGKIEKESLTSALRDRRWMTYRSKVLNSWYASHARKEEMLDEYGNKVIDPYTGKPQFTYVPLEHLYSNEKYQELTDKEKQILGKLMDIKKQLDSYLPPHTVPSYRSPQFTSDIITDVKNISQKDIAVHSKFLQGIKELLNKYSIPWGIAVAGGALLSSGFVGGAALSFTLALSLRRLTVRHLWNMHKTLEEEEQANITEKNVFLTGGDMENGVYTSTVALTFDEVRRVPIYGVKKLQQMNRLNTDPFSSMLSYAHMAYSYMAMQKVAVFGEAISSELDYKRTQNANNAEGARYDVLNTDFKKWMDKHVYNLKSYQTCKSWGSLFVKHITYLASNVMRTYASARTLIYLGGNVSSALINALTAHFEIMKLTLGRTGDYGYGDLWYARWRLAQHLISSVWHMKGLLSNKGQVVNDDKLFLIAKRFGIRDMDYNNFKMSRRFHYLNSILSSDSLLLPYSTLDFLMQSVTYIATLHSTKVVKLQYNEDDGQYQVTKSTNLWKAYRAVRSQTDGDFDDLRNNKDTAELIHTIYEGNEDDGYTASPVFTCYETDASGNRVEVIKDLKNGTVIELTPVEASIDDRGTSIDGKKFFKYTLLRTDDDEGIYTFQVREIFQPDNGDPEIEYIHPPVTLYKHYMGKKNLETLLYDEDLFIEDTNLTRLVNSEQGEIMGIQDYMSYEERERAKRRAADEMRARGEEPSEDLAPSDIPRKWLVRTSEGKLTLNPKVIASPGEGKPLSELYRIVQLDNGAYKVYRRYDSDAEAFLAHRIRINNQRMHGVYDDEGQNLMVSRLLIGPLMMNMRKYYIGLFENAWGMPKYSIYKGCMTEGFNITAAKMGWCYLIMLYDFGYRVLGALGGKWGKGQRLLMTKQAASNLVMQVKYLSEFLTALFGSGQKCTYQMRALGFSDYQIGNYRKMIGTFASMFILLMQMDYFSPPETPPEDDEDKDKQAEEEAKAKNTDIVYDDPLQNWKPTYDSLGKFFDNKIEQHRKKGGMWNAMAWMEENVLKPMYASNASRSFMTAITLGMIDGFTSKNWVMGSSNYWYGGGGLASLNQELAKELFPKDVQEALLNMLKTEGALFRALVGEGLPFSIFNPMSIQLLGVNAKDLKDMMDPKKPEYNSLDDILNSKHLFDPAGILYYHSFRPWLEQLSQPSLLNLMYDPEVVLGEFFGVTSAKDLIGLVNTFENILIPLMNAYNNPFPYDKEGNLDILVSMGKNGQGDPRYLLAEGVGKAFKSSYYTASGPYQGHSKGIIALARLLPYIRTNVKYSNGYASAAGEWWLKKLLLGWSTHSKGIPKGAANYEDFNSLELLMYAASHSDEYALGLFTERGVEPDQQE